MVVHHRKTVYRGHGLSSKSLRLLSEKSSTELTRSPQNKTMYPNARSCVLFNRFAQKKVAMVAQKIANAASAVLTYLRKGEH